MKPPPMPPYCPPMDPIEVLHKDASLLIVIKPAGLLSVEGKGPALADCLHTRVLAMDPDARLIHRLDMDTSGVMVFARTAAAQRHLGLQFERRHVCKVYVARVGGVVHGDAGQIDLPLTSDWPNRPLQKVCHETGRAALTEWSVRVRDVDYTTLELRPHTGRTHQLRVHCREIGYPIIGDRFYGGAIARRLMLHAETLILRHPEGGVEHRFTTPAEFDLPVS